MLLKLLVTVLLPVWFSPADDSGLVEHELGIRRGMARAQVEKIPGMEPCGGYVLGDFGSGSTMWYPGGITVHYDGADRVKKVEFRK